MAVSAYLLENAILGFLHELPGPTVGHLQLFPNKKNDNCPTNAREGGGCARLKLTEP